MKSSLLLSLLLLSACQSPPPAPVTDDGGVVVPVLKGTITFSGAWALYPLVVKWGEEFQKLHPEVRVDVAAGGAGKGMADALADVVDLGMVSRDLKPEEVAKGAWWVSVAKDAVIPTYNVAHPLAAELRARGASQAELAAMFLDEDETAKNWGALVPGGEALPVHVFTRSDACGAAQTFAEFLGKDQEDLQGIGVYGDPGLADAVLKDPLAVGFNNVNYAYDAATLLPVAGLGILPLDLNGDGSIQPEEDFYTNRDQLAAAIAADRFPSPPARALHLVAQGVPQKPLVREFLRWILTEGQQYIPDAGYIKLPDEKLGAALAGLSEPVNP